MRSIARLAFRYVVLMLLAPAVMGARVGDDQPTRVRVGLYLRQMERINDKEQAFDAEFYLYLTWKGKRSARDYEFVNWLH